MSTCRSDGPREVCMSVCRVCATAVCIYVTYVGTAQEETVRCFGNGASTGGQPGAGVVKKCPEITGIKRLTASQCHPESVVYRDNWLQGIRDLQWYGEGGHDLIGQMTYVWLCVHSVHRSRGLLLPLHRHDLSQQNTECVTPHHD